jgi:hypothetical protein
MFFLVNQCEIKLPKTSQEFVRDWQRSIKTTEQRYAYLTECEALLLGQVFKTEVSLLGEILAALSVFQEQNIQQVLEILQVLKMSKRFSLSLQFLSKNEKEGCAHLFDRLLDVCGESDQEQYKDQVLELKSVYLS